MNEDKSTSKQIDDFKKTIDGLENIEVKLQKNYKESYNDRRNLGSTTL